MENNTAEFNNSNITTTINDDTSESTNDSSTIITTIDNDNNRKNSISSNSNDYNSSVKTTSSSSSNTPLSPKTFSSMISSPSLSSTNSLISDYNNDYNDIYEIIKNKTIKDDDTVSTMSIGTCGTQRTINLKLADLIKENQRIEKGDDGDAIGEGYVGYEADGNNLKIEYSQNKSQGFFGEVEKEDMKVELDDAGVFDFDDDSISMINDNTRANTIEAGIKEKQECLLTWVKLLWPQPKLPTTKQAIDTGVVCRSFNNTMVVTAEVTGTKYLSPNEKRKQRLNERNTYCTPKIVTHLYDPREFLLIHCPSYKNPPSYNNDPRNPWDHSFILEKVLPKITAESIQVQDQPGLFVTVKETLMRGLDTYYIYECKKCMFRGYVSTFNYDGIRRHISKSHRDVVAVVDELIRVNPKEYVIAFAQNLPPKIKLP
nr:10336_t:CDS:2 [Entrophospora candida]CAG8572984.1 294_t:CDS:2 [Entrophospora candida]